MEELIADAYAVLQQQIPFQPSAKLPFPDEVSKSGSFLGGVLGRSSVTGLLALPPKAAALEAVLLLSRVKNGDFSARVVSVPIAIRRLASAERSTPGPIPLDIQNFPMFPVTVGVVRLFDDQFFNELLALGGLPGLLQERLSAGGHLNILFGHLNILFTAVLERYHDNTTDFAPQRTGHLNILQKLFSF